MDWRGNRVRVIAPSSAGGLAARLPVTRIFKGAICKNFSLKH